MKILSVILNDMVKPVSGKVRLHVKVATGAKPKPKAVMPKKK